ncbi:MAG: hypothetical protein ACF8PN_06820 [Phycisphaerales bacterium]
MTKYAHHELRDAALGCVDALLELNVRRTLWGFLQSVREADPGSEWTEICECGRELETAQNRYADASKIDSLDELIERARIETGRPPVRVNGSTYLTAHEAAGSIATHLLTSLNTAVEFVDESPEILTDAGWFGRALNEVWLDGLPDGDTLEEMVVYLREESRLAESLIESGWSPSPKHEPLTVHEQQLWDALEDRALSGASLRTLLILPSEDQARRLVGSIRSKRGRDSIKTARGLGYFRPDAPPIEVSDR